MKDPDTGIGGRDGRFPVTRPSAIEAARSGDPAVREGGHGRIVAAYWKPAYVHVRFKWRASNEEAKDLVQGFFTQALEKGFLEQHDPAKASFRTWLRTCLDRFVSKEREATSRQKRGGGLLESLDFDAAERSLAGSPGPSPEEAFHAEWIRSLLELALGDAREKLDATGRGVNFELLRAADLDAGDGGARPSYAELSARFGLPVTKVTNYLHVARAEVRRALVERLRELTSSEDELRAELRRVLGTGA